MVLEANEGTEDPACESGHDWRAEGRAKAGTYGCHDMRTEGISKHFGKAVGFPAAMSIALLGAHPELVWY